MSEAPAPGASPGEEGVPDAFRPWLEAWLPPGSPGDRATLVAAGVRALEAALAPEGRQRAGAFDLLAADALVTRACEAAAAEPDPGAALADVLRRVARERP